ncbi:conserved hypothetical protein [Ricinus communis]|uniref:Uncharacterized protein n=1 Tax=Ricinus communis TaxID=3988 RepID=B9TAS9_RICCO|nr:conserved hypothetical protein [Ricinus communis]
MAHQADVNRAQIDMLTTEKSIGSDDIFFWTGDTRVVPRREERCWHQTSYEASFLVPRRPPRSMATALAIPGHLLAAQDESLGYPAADYLDRQTEYTS